MGNYLGRIVVSQLKDILTQGFKSCRILYKVNGSRNKFLAGIHVTDMYCSTLVGQGKGILGLMVLGHIGRRNQDNRLTQQAKFRYGTCSCT